ncbi:LysR family transcriptional regulator [Halomonas sp. DP5N14-9]|uniref:LysR family transcriptional regulator n=1 Tax=Halomonas sp. DP5N14-9 TaxID=2859075 RepID=UPI001C99BBF2|nr:LysR family transcriptional regulator [Halomonas sp. DP5N14-9]MBY5940367.1 LysR family transcriptional regulator [Halomonas sp. DP5N14-9]
MQDYPTLRAFVTVAHLGSVSRAAEALHLTQPAVSLKLKQLQATLGLTLFHRRPQGLELTAHGQALLPTAEKALESARVFDQMAHSLHSTVRGLLRIGTIIDPEFIRLGSFLKVLVERAPELETELHHGMSGYALSRVERGELDAGFYLAPPGTGSTHADGAGELAFVELTHFRYYVVAPSGWESRVEDTRWSTLATLPWIVTPPDSVHHRLLKRAMQDSGETPRRVAQVDQEACMLDLVRAGVGLSLARDSLALTERQRSGLTIVEGVTLDCALCFVWKKERTREPPLQAALATLESVWPNRPE